MKAPLSLLLLTLASLAAEETTPAPSPTPSEREQLEIIKAAAHPDAFEPFTPKELGFQTKRATALKLVAMTLDLNPQVEIQKTNVTERRGILQSEQGAFDTHLTGRLGPEARFNNRSMSYRELPPKGQPQPTPFPNPLRYRRGVMDYEIGVRKMINNGMVINPTVGFSQRTERDYGQTFEQDLRGAFGFHVTIPLGKGGGRQFNLAPQEAARFDLLASTLQLRHLTAQSVANTLKAYWAAKAAEEVYRLRVESEAISTRLLGVGTSLAEGDEIAPAELAQMLADRRNTMAQRIRAEVALITSRQSLATAVGLPPAALLVAPLPADAFPEPPRKDLFPNNEPLVELALRLRDDLRAARQTAASRKTLLDASYLNLRPTVNLELNANYAPFETRNQSVQTGGKEWQIGATFSLDWPIENQTARGEVLQHQARYQNSQISLEDNRRVITSQVITALAELEGAAVNVHLFGEAVGWYVEALKAQEDLFALGQGSLSDTITARQRLVDAQVNAVTARQNYATALVQLRFATGLLLFSDERGSWVDPESWRQIPLGQKARR